MCDTADDGVGISNSIPAQLKLRNRGLRTADISELMPFACQLVNSRENRDSHIGFVGYNKTKPGNRILIAIDPVSPRGMRGESPGLRPAALPRTVIESPSFRNR